MRNYLVEWKESRNIIEAGLVLVGIMTEVTTPVQVVAPDSSRVRPPIDPRSMGRVVDAMPQYFGDLVRVPAVEGGGGRRGQEQLARARAAENIPSEAEVPKSSVEERFDETLLERQRIRIQADRARGLLVVFDEEQSRQLSSQSVEMGQRLVGMNAWVDGLAQEIVNQGEAEAGLVQRWRNDGVGDREIAQRVLEGRAREGVRVARAEEQYRNLRQIERSLMARRQALAGMLTANSELMGTQIGEAYGANSHRITAADKGEVLREMQREMQMIEILEQQREHLTIGLVEAAGDIIGTADERQAMIEDQETIAAERRNTDVVRMGEGYITQEGILEEFNELVGQVERNLGSRLSAEARQKLEQDLGIRREERRQVINGKTEFVTKVSLTQDSILGRRLDAVELARAARETYDQSMHEVEEGVLTSVEEACTALNAWLTGEALAEICQVQEIELAGLNACEELSAMAEELGLVERYGELEHLLRTKFAGVRERTGELAKGLGEFFKDKVFTRETVKKLGKGLLYLIIALLVGTVGGGAMLASVIAGGLGGGR